MSICIDACMYIYIRQYLHIYIGICARVCRGRGCPASWIGSKHLYAWVHTSIYIYTIVHHHASVLALRQLSQNSKLDPFIRTLLSHIRMLLSHISSMHTFASLLQLKSLVMSLLFPTIFLVPPLNILGSTGPLQGPLPSPNSDIKWCLYHPFLQLVLVPR